MSLAFARFAEEQGIPPERYSEAAREFVRLDCGDEVLTKQADKDAADINIIMRRNMEQGILPQSRMVPVYADISDIGSLQEALAVMDQARDDFYALSAPVRAAFGNDPRAFVAASQDPSKADLFKSLGLTREEPPAGSAGGSGTVAT